MVHDKRRGALLAPGLTLGGIATTLLMVNVMVGAVAFWVGLFVLYVLSIGESSG